MSQGARSGQFQPGAQVTTSGPPVFCAPGITQEMKMIASSIKAEVVKDNARAAGDTGSPEVQVALLTARINELTPHFKTQGR